MRAGEAPCLRQFQYGRSWRNLVDVFLILSTSRRHRVQCGTARRGALWQALLVALHFPPLVQKLFPQRWGGAIATVHSSSHKPLQPVEWLCPGPGQEHTPALQWGLLGWQPPAATRQQAGRDHNVLNCSCCLGKRCVIEASVGSRHGQAKLGLLRGYRGAGDNPFILLAPCGVTYVGCKPALLAPNHTWEVWSQTQEVQLLFPQTFLDLFPMQPPSRVHAGALAFPTQGKISRCPPLVFPQTAGCGRGRLGAARVPSPGGNPKSGVWPGFREGGGRADLRLFLSAVGVRRTGLREAGGAVPGSAGHVPGLGGVSQGRCPGGAGGVRQPETWLKLLWGSLGSERLSWKKPHRLCRALVWHPEFFARTGPVNVRGELGPELTAGV